MVVEAALAIEAVAVAEVDTKKTAHVQLRTCKKIIFHFWPAVASAGGVSKIRTTHQ